MSRTDRSPLIAERLQRALAGVHGLLARDCAVVVAELVAFGARTDEERNRVFAAVTALNAEVERRLH